VKKKKRGIVLMLRYVGFDFGTLHHVTSCSDNKCLIISTIMDDTEQVYLLFCRLGEVIILDTYNANVAFRNGYAC
jgi:hypothetical protein